MMRHSEMLVQVFGVLVVMFGYGSCLDANVTDKTPLYIGGLMPMVVGGRWRTFHGVFVGAQLAVEDINNRDDVLPNYELVVEWKDTRGDLPLTLDLLYDFLNKRPAKVAIFGPALSPVVEVVGRVIGRRNIVEMAPVASSPIFADESKYPTTFRIVTSAEAFGSAQAQFVKQFDWSKIATLHEDGEPHKGIINKLNLEALMSNISIIISETFVTDPLGALKRIKEKDARIIVSSFFGSTAQKIFCHAFDLGMYGPDYVWILSGYIPSSWQSSTKGVHCSSEELRIASEGYFKFGFIMYGLSQDVGRCGKKPEEFRKEISPLVGYNVTVNDPSFGALAYDGMWALALAMHEAQDTLTNGLDSYQYGDSDYAKTIMGQIRNLDFDGMSGPVQFTNGCDRLGNQRLLQNIDGKDVPIGTYDSIADRTMFSVPVDKLWYYSGGKPPHDSDTTLTVTSLQATPLAIMICMSVLASLGLLLDFAFIGFNIINRKHKQIKMSSPKVNNVIACGFMLAYLCVVLLGIDRSMVGEGTLLHICRMRSWLFVIAFTLSFGGMFTKMWRIYSIVIANKTKRKVIKDRYLFGIIAVLLLVDFVILLPWQIIDPIHIEETQVPVPQTAEDIASQQRRQLLYVNCTSKNNTIWIMILLIYKAFVVVFGAFLAWSTRNINVPGLNDSYYVGLSIYNTVICCVVAVPLSFLAVSSIGVTFALVSGFLLFCITASLCMLFFPKIIAVYRKIDVTCNTATGMIGTTATSAAAAGKPFGLPSTSTHNEMKSVSEVPIKRNL